MFIPKEKDVIVLRDGRVVYVTGVTEQDPDAYRLYDYKHYEETGEFKINSEMPVETIVIGKRIVNFHSYELGETVVTDFSEVVGLWS